MAELVPGQVLDQYEVEDVVARGGMATIYRARDRDNGHEVALKVPHMQYASDLVFHERFLREETIGQRLDHPAIIRVLRPREKSRLYLAMGYVDGELLRERLRRGGFVPTSRPPSRRPSSTRSSASRPVVPRAPSSCASCSPIPRASC